VHDSAWVFWVLAPFEFRDEGDFAVVADRPVLGGFVDRAPDREGRLFLDVLPALFLETDLIATRPSPGQLSNRILIWSYCQISFVRAVPERTFGSGGSYHHRLLCPWRSDCGLDPPSLLCFVHRNR
jgi:hypothetical protein